MRCEGIAWRRGGRKADRRIARTARQKSAAYAGIEKSVE
jgi:hypothetical protein